MAPGCRVSDEGVLSFSWAISAKVNKFPYQFWFLVPFFEAKGLELFRRFELGVPGKGKEGVFSQKIKKRASG